MIINLLKCRCATHMKVSSLLGVNFQGFRYILHCSKKEDLKIGPSHSHGTI